MADNGRHDRLRSNSQDLEWLTLNSTKWYKTSKIETLIQSATDQKVRGSNPFVRTRRSANPRSMTWGFVFHLTHSGVVHIRESPGYWANLERISSCMTVVKRLVRAGADPLFPEAARGRISGSGVRIGVASWRLVTWDVAVLQGVPGRARYARSRTGRRAGRTGRVPHRFVHRRDFPPIWRWLWCTGSCSSAAGAQRWCVTVTAYRCAGQTIGSGGGR